MKSFSYVSAPDTATALRTIADHEDVKFLAGGTNLVDLMREGIEHPATVVDITRLPLTGIEELPDGSLRVGALVTNTGPDSAEVSAMTASPGAAALAAEPLRLAWPPEIFSLSHVALPFAPDDPVYGGAPPEGTETVRLGRLTPRGEKDVLIVPLDSLMRVSWNPFFGYLADRIDRAAGQ